MTIRQIVSQLSNDVKATMDTRLAPKYIWNKWQYNLANFVKQVNETRRIYKSADSWYRINCVEMETVNASICPEIAVLVKEFVAKSKKKLPATYTSAAGDMIRDITSIFPYGKQYILVTPGEYSKIRKREFKDPTIGYAFIIDDYLYIPDSEIEKVAVTGMWLNPMEAVTYADTEFCGCKEVKCKAFLDYDCYMPEYLIKIVHDSVLADILNSNKRVPKDENPNMNERE